MKVRADPQRSTLPSQPSSFKATSASHTTSTSSLPAHLTPPASSSVQPLKSSFLELPQASIEGPTLRPGPRPPPSPRSPSNSGTSREDLLRESLASSWAIASPRSNTASKSMSPPEVKPKPRSLRSNGESWTHETSHFPFEPPRDPATPQSYRTQTGRKQPTLRELIMVEEESTIDGFSEGGTEADGDTDADADMSDSAASGIGSWWGRRTAGSGILGIMASTKARRRRKMSELSTDAESE
jgi:hypothetical protein